MPNHAAVAILLAGPKGLVGVAAVAAKAIPAEGGSVLFIQQFEAPGVTKGEGDLPYTRRPLEDQKKRAEIVFRTVSPGFCSVLETQAHQAIKPEDGGDPEAGWWLAEASMQTTIKEKRVTLTPLRRVTDAEDRTRWIIDPDRENRAAIPNRAAHTLSPVGEKIENSMETPVSSWLGLAEAFGGAPPFSGKLNPDVEGIRQKERAFQERQANPRRRDFGPRHRRPVTDDELLRRLPPEEAQQLIRLRQQTLDTLKG